MMRPLSFFSFFFFNDTATTEIYTLSLHDALPICETRTASGELLGRSGRFLYTPMTGIGVNKQTRKNGKAMSFIWDVRSEEHTSELQSQSNLVCRLLLEKKKRYYISRGAHRLII